MATIVNERDVLIRSAPSRLVDHDLASNVNVPVFKGISLAAPGAIFRLAVNGDVSPTSITATVSHRGFAEAPAITWSVVYGDLTVEPSGTGLTYEMVAANMVTDVVTVQASVTVAGMTYTDAIMFVKIQDGSVGLPGSRGTINAVRAITGTAWSTPEAVQALADYGLEDPFDPIAGDVVTLHNLNEGFSEIRRFSGSVWVLEAPAFPGRNILKGSVATEQLLVTGMAEALNSDPNTVDITAWNGNGLSIVADATAPNGATALRCAGEGTTVLSRRFPVNDSDNYQVKTWAKADSGSPTAYLLVAFFDASGAVLPGSTNAAGWTSVGDYHYFGLANQVMPTTWTNYEASFGKDETFKVPAGARYASVGLISNFSSGTVQRISGMVCRRKVDGRVVVDGSLSARHVVTNGMSVVNEFGVTLLEATGSSVPPWVVGVTSQAEDGSLVWTQATDASNRTAIRGLIVDQVALKADYSDSGRAITLSSAARDVWSVYYDGSYIMYPSDGQAPFWEASFQLEPARMYTFQYRIRARRDTTTGTTDGLVSVAVYLPAGASGNLDGGSGFTAPSASVIPLTDEVAYRLPGSVKTISETPLRTVYIRSGPAGGTLQFLGSASIASLILEGTEFSAIRHNNVTVPQPTVPRTSVPVVGPLRQGGAYTLATPSEAWSYHYSVVLNPVEDANGIGSSMAVIGASVVFGTTDRDAAVWFGVFTQGDGTCHPNITPKFKIPAAFVIQEGISEAERPRWVFELQMALLSSSWATHASTPSKLLTLNVPGSRSYAGTLESFDLSSLSSHELTSTYPENTFAPQGYADYLLTVIRRYEGAQVGDPVKVRLTYTIV